MRDDAQAIRDALTDPVALCDALGLIHGRRSYQRQARGLTVCCPAHNERTPSCSVTLGPDRTIRVRCFGCGWTADAFGLIAMAHQLDVRRDFRRVLELAADLAGHRLEPSTYPLHKSDEPPPLDNDTFDTIACVLAHECPLAAQGDVCLYLHRRGLLEQVGATWFALPPIGPGLDRARGAVVAAVGEDAWRRSGLADKTGRWAYPHHRLCIPWRSAGVDGVVTTIQRRLVGEPRDKNERKYVFPRGRPPRQPYGLCDALEAIGPATAIAFCEGALDAVALTKVAREDGLDWAPLGVPGTKGWHKSWAELACGRTAVIALDPDAAGEGGVATMEEDLWNAGAARVQRAVPEGADDWAALLAKVADDAA